MFKLESSDGFWYPVSYEQRAEEGGRMLKKTLDVRFKRMRTSEKNALVKKMSAGEMDDIGMCQEIVVNWRGVALNGDSETQFSPATAVAFYDEENVARAIITGWLEAISPGGKVKN